MLRVSERKGPGRAACAFYKPFEELQPHAQEPVSRGETIYCDLPVELPELEPPELPLVEPEPMPLLEGVLGEVVELGEVVLLPLAPEPALEPDLLKYASHSCRET